MGVLIGIDPHKATNAAAAINERAEELLEYAVFSTNRAGLRSLERWGKRFPERRWAVEGAGGLWGARSPWAWLPPERGSLTYPPSSLPGGPSSCHGQNAHKRTTGWTPFTSPWPPSGASGSPMWMRKSTPRY